MDKASAHGARIVGSSPTMIILFLHSVTSHVPLCCKPTSPSGARSKKCFHRGKYWLERAHLTFAVLTKSGLFASQRFSHTSQIFPPGPLETLVGAWISSGVTPWEVGLNSQNSALARLWMGWVQAPLARGPVAQWIRHRPTEPGIVGLSPVAGQSKTSRCVPKLFSPGKTWLDRMHLTFTAKSGLICPSTSHELALWSSGMTLWEGRGSIPRTALAKSCRGWVQARLP